MNMMNVRQLTEGMDYPEAVNLLQSLHKDDIITEDCYRQVYNDMTRKEILKNHSAKISQHTDGRWRTYITTPEGKKKQLVRTTRKKLEDDIVENYKQVHGEEAGGMTFDECYHRWRELHDLTTSDNTQAKYNSDYERYFAGEDFTSRPIANINREDIEKFVFKKVMELSLCRGATKTLLNYIKGTFRSAKNNRTIREDVAKDIPQSEFYPKCVEVEKAPDAVLVPDEDWKALYDLLQTYFRKRPMYMPPYAVLMASYTGMRVGELAALQWDDVRTDPVSGRSYFLISRSERYDVKTNEYSIGDVKNGHTRVYPITPQISDLLQTLKKVQLENGILCEWIFSDGKGGNFHKKPIMDFMKNACKKLGITTKGIHAFRRQLNSDMRCDGVSAITTSAMIGNTPSVNDKHYTFDVTGLAEKERIVELENQKRLNVAKR